MATDQYGNYQAGLRDAGQSLPNLSPTQQVFGPTDGDVVGGVPQVTPTTAPALYIGSDGTQYQWFSGAWH